MNRIDTPELEPAVLDRLTGYTGLFEDHLITLARPLTYGGVYLQGLFLDGDGKGIEPIPRRVHLPDGQMVADLVQALQQFLGQSPWDD